MLRLISRFFTVLVMPLAALAQAPAAPQPVQSAATGSAKLAWIDLRQAIASCDEGKRELGEVQKFVDKKNAELEALRKEFETLKNQLSVQASKLTDEARADFEDQLETKDRNLRRFQEDTQREIEDRQVRTTNSIGRRMLPVIEKLSKERGLTAVLTIDPSRDVWVDPSHVITDEVIRAYNQTYAGQKPATSTPAPPPTPAQPPPPKKE